jgi:signal transduction histidine kinase
VAHEIQNPISYVLAGLYGLREMIPPLESTLETYRGLARRALPREAEAEIRGAESKLEQAGGLEDLESLVADTLEGAERIRDLVRDLLTLSRPRGMEPGPVDVNEVLGATLRLVSRGLRGRAALEQDLRATRSVVGNAAHLGQVFLNLLTNAVEACDPPDAARHRIVVRSADTSEGIRVEVRDTGVGIPRALGSRVFEPFFSRRESGRGMGLGLYLSRRIVEQHGGTIGYRGGPGGGTTFFVELPEVSRARRDGPG